MRVKIFTDEEARERKRIRSRKFHALHREERNAYARTYNKSERGKQAYKNSALRFPEKVKAREIVSNAIRDGRLKRELCHCGKYGHAHHEDYSNPLEVIWLCTTHHKELHRKEEK